MKKESISHFMSYDCKCNEAVNEYKKHKSVEMDDFLCYNMLG